MANNCIKLLKEREKLLKDIETKLSDQLKSLKKEEIYLLTVLTQESTENKDEKEEGRMEEVTGVEDMDNDDINRVPLTDLNAASKSFYQMFAGNDTQRVEDEEEVDEEEEEVEEDPENEEAEMTEEQKMAKVQKLLNSMQGDG